MPVTHELKECAAHPMKKYICVAYCQDKNDLNLHQRIKRFLAARSVSDLNTLDIHVDGGHVVLRGRVMSSEDHRVCVGSIRRVAGVLDVIDELRIEHRRF